LFSYLPLPKGFLLHLTYRFQKNILKVQNSAGDEKEHKTLVFTLESFKFIFFISIVALKIPNVKWGAESQPENFFLYCHGKHPNPSFRPILPKP
jgi:hypothetical protein